MGSSPASAGGSRTSGGPGGSVSFLRPGLRATSDLLEQASKFWSSLAKLKGSTIRTGFPRIDRLLKPAVNRYVVCAARPGLFKTTLAWNMAVNLALAGRRVLWLGTEMLPQEQVGWVLSRLTRIPVETLTRYGTGEISLDSSEKQNLHEYEDKIATLPMVVWPHTGLEIQEMEECARAAPYDAVFLDYVQLVTTRHTKEYDQVKAVSLALQKLSRDLPIWIFALSQMNREIEHHEGKPRLPQLSDLKGTGQLEQDADAVCFLHRLGGGESKNRVDLRIVKNRYGEPDVYVPLRAEPEYRTISEEADAPPPDPISEPRAAPGSDPRQPLPGAAP